MIQNYIDLLRKTTESLTTLGNSSNGTLFNYFQAVGLEISVLLLGLLYAAGTALIVSFPFWGIKWLLKKQKKHSVYGRWEIAFEEYDKWREPLYHEYENLCEEDAISGKDLQAEWDELKRKIEEKGISLDGIKIENWFKSTSKKNEAACPYRDLAYSLYLGELPGQFACGFDKEKVKAKKRSYISGKAAIIIGIVVLYAIFLIPFIMMLNIPKLVFYNIIGVGIAALSFFVMPFAMYLAKNQ